VKTDMQLMRDVQDELQWQPNLRTAEIGVSARDGVVTLTGFVPSYSQKLMAARAAGTVAGVRGVADELLVRLPNANRRSDTDIARSAVSALQWHVDVPDTKLTVKVADGWITLSGDVDWQYEQASAEDAVRSLTGVKGVINNTVVRQPKASAFEVSRKITEALKRSATVDAGRISVEATEGKVVLKGTVRAWSERQDAERAAWSAPCVTLVEDRLTVGV